MRPNVGAQAQFRKKKPPVTYRYDSSLSPALDWDEQNPAREQADVAIRRILEAKTLEEAKRAGAHFGTREKLPWFAREK
jgi:adenine-specific DNA-methyltransferase